ncbi:SDR family NAD(P)-dependent oxidoreductase [Hoeflea sp. WL0058]|uniref:SDR family NAD(P)-dependent oxidoreductase n=1 Tax=Flavimaribacter sediminis TaxID=2865987 RepID=A0AAE2ZSL2_9HYPH|nr:SDR family NAD(P)-dependent oxidoreductase [Flavimaribacter sediminis]
MTQETIIITGASRGIGRALTALCLERGHPVVAVARNLDDLERLSPSGSPLQCHSADLSNPQQAAAAGEAIAAALSDRAILVNNAATQDDWQFFDARNTADALTRNVALNLTAPILLTRILCGAASIDAVVFIQSLLSLEPKGSAAVYSAAKAGLGMVAKALRLQSKDGKIRFQEVYLPLVDTDMTAGRGTGKISPEVAAEQIYKAIMSGRPRVYVGKARLMAAIHWLSPALAGFILSRM